VDAAPETAAKSVGTSAADARNKALKEQVREATSAIFLQAGNRLSRSVSAILTGVLAMASHLP
jgi:hypothetical protein